MQTYRLRSILRNSLRPPSTDKVPQLFGGHALSSSLRILAIPLIMDHAVVSETANNPLPNPMFRVPSYIHGHGSYGNPTPNSRSEKREPHLSTYHYVTIG